MRTIERFVVDFTRSFYEKMGQGAQLEDLLHILRDRFWQNNTVPEIVVVAPISKIG